MTTLRLIAASRCFFNALFNLRGAVHHEPILLIAQLFVGCWISAMHPCASAPQLDHHATVSLFCRLPGLPGWAFWLYNLCMPARENAVYVWL